MRLGILGPPSIVANMKPILAKTPPLFPLLFLLFSLPSCAHYPENAPLTHFNPRAGYRFENLPATPQDSDDLFIVVSFSGGGSRAAAFSYGVLEELHKTPIEYHGPPRTMLDEVDVISSVSGGSFTAAYYALYHDRIFQDYAQRFLYDDVQDKVVGSILNPLNWPRLVSPTFDRIDLAAEYYDQHVFDHHTYADLIRAHQRPYLLLNASDISLGTRFEFTQEQFDFLYSDLGSVPLARAVAASSAFPIALSPLALENYPKGADFQEAPWVRSVLRDPAVSSRVKRRAEDLISYEDTANRPHIRLLDGAIADYMGLRGPYQAMISPEGDFSIRRMIDSGKIKKLVFISANVVRTPPIVWDRQDHAPGWYDMLYFTASAPIRNNSFDTVNVFEDLLHSDSQVVESSKRYQEAVGKYDAAAAKKIAIPPGYDAYFISLDFENVKERDLRERLEAMPSRLSLPKADVDDLRRAAAELLRDSPEFQRLLRDLSTQR